MFFQSKIRNEAKKATESTYQQIFSPLISKYLDPFKEKFIRPIVKPKKKLSKVAKLKLEIEDQQIEHDENMFKMKKDHAKVVSNLNEEVKKSKEEYSTLEFRAKIITGVLVSLLLIQILRFFYSLFF